MMTQLGNLNINKIYTPSVVVVRTTNLVQFELEFLS
jgi:hypothetical protein